MPAACPQFGRCPPVWPVPVPGLLDPVTEGTSISEQARVPSPVPQFPHLRSPCLWAGPGGQVARAPPGHAHTPTPSMEPEIPCPPVSPAIPRCFLVSPSAHSRALGRSPARALLLLGRGPAAVVGSGPHVPAARDCPGVMQGWVGVRGGCDCSTAQGPGGRCSLQQNRMRVQLVRGHRGSRPSPSPAAQVCAGTASAQHRGTPVPRREVPSPAQGPTAACACACACTSTPHAPTWLPRLGPGPRRLGVRGGLQPQKRSGLFLAAFPAVARHIPAAREMCR